MPYYPLYLFLLFLLYLTLFDKAGVMLPLNFNSLYSILDRVFANAVTSLSVAFGKYAWAVSCIIVLKMHWSPR